MGTGPVVGARVSSKLRTRMAEFQTRNGLKNESAVIRVCLEIVLGDTVVEAFVASRIVAARAAIDRRIEDIFGQLQQDMVAMVRDELGGDVETPLPSTLPKTTTPGREAAAEAYADDVVPAPPIEEDLDEDADDDEPDEDEDAGDETPPQGFETRTQAPDIEPMDPSATLTGLRRKRAAAPIRRKR